MTHIKIFLWKYKKKFNIIVYFHIFSAFKQDKAKRRRVVYISFLKEVLVLVKDNGVYISDYIARLTPLNFLFRFCWGGLKKEVKDDLCNFNFYIFIEFIKNFF